MAILQRIQDGLSQFAGSEAKVARIVLSDPSMVEHYTITRLAQDAGTSTSAVLRFCHSLGFAGYKEFRFEVMAELRDGAPELELVPDVVGVATRGMANAVTALDGLDRAELALLVDQLISSSVVLCIGVHRSFLPAEKLRMDLEDAGIVALSARDTVQATHFANLVSDTTCTMVFSVSGSFANFRSPIDSGLVSQGHSWLVTPNRRAPLSTRFEHTIVLPQIGQAGAGGVDEHPVAMAFVELVSVLVRASRIA